MFIEEKIAKSLFSDILEYFKYAETKPLIELDGAGVHWYCKVNIKSIKVSVKSCDISYLKGNQGPTEEFIISYFRNDKEVACGRTSNRVNLIGSIDLWLNSKSKEQLYLKYDFVDHDLRTVENLEKTWIKKFPELGNISRVLEHTGSGIVRYQISNKDRSCWTTGFGHQGELYFGFVWDGCLIFETESIRRETAEVLKRYLIDREAPSSLNKEFSWIPINNLTESYEKGKGIEGEFIESWELSLLFYKRFPETSLPDKNKIIKLIHGLKDQGFNKTIRAGTSLTRLILSRSRRHGLMENQPFMNFAFVNNKIHLSTKNGKIYILDKIQLTPGLIEQIKELEKEDIN